MRLFLLSAIACLVAGGDWESDDIAAPIEQLVMNLLTNPAPAHAVRTLTLVVGADLR